jgi:hypothetical protein
MSQFGEKFFSGSRFIFWSLAPVLIGFAALLTAVLPLESTRYGIAVGLIWILCLSLVIGLYDPIRFRWALRVVTGIVFGLYAIYVVEELWKYFVLDTGRLTSNRSTPSVVTSLLGFIVIGVPCFIFTVKGRFGWSKAIDDVPSEENNGSG